MSDLTEKLLAALLRQTKAIEAQTQAIRALAESNEHLVDAMLACEPEQDEDLFGVDMAGNQVAPS